jgi:hypothetical protein
LGEGRSQEIPTNGCIAQYPLSLGEWIKDTPERDAELLGTSDIQSLADLRIRTLLLLLKCDCCRLENEH